MHYVNSTSLLMIKTEKYTAPIIARKKFVKIGLHEYVLSFDKDGFLVYFGAVEVKRNVDNRFNLFNLKNTLKR